MINPDGTVPTAPDGMAVITSVPDTGLPTSTAGPEAQTGGETPPGTVQLLGGITVTTETRRTLAVIGVLSLLGYALTR